MNLYEWATRWNIQPDAMQQLLDLFGVRSNTNPTDMSEAAIQQRIRLRASQKGARLWRNNVGAFDPDNPPSPWTRWGLCNDSAALNAQIKSSDLIGITPVTHAGQTFGVFTAYEVKRGDWSYKGNKREIAQLNFIQLVNSMGGIAQFINDPGDL